MSGRKLVSVTALGFSIACVGQEAGDDRHALSGECSICRSGDTDATRDPFGLRLWFNLLSAASDSGDSARTATRGRVCGVGETGANVFGGAFRNVWRTQAVGGNG